MTFLTLVRHGQTDWNLERRIQGSTDIPLNGKGQEDALRAAESLRNETHDAIFSSPLTRARQTAEIIAEQLGLAAPAAVADVREREFGVAEGILTADYLRTFGSWHADVPEAESLATVRDRALRALDGLAQDARRRSAPRVESLVVVTHGGVIRALLDHASNGSLPLEGAPILNGSVHRFEASPGLLRLIDSTAA